MSLSYVSVYLEKAKKKKLETKFIKLKIITKMNQKIELI